jgi:hypothetical protein
MARIARSSASTGYDRLLRIGLILAFIGMAIVLFGVASDSRKIRAIGTAVFLSCIAIWGLVNGGAMFLAFWRDGRHRGFTNTWAQQPGWSILYLVLMLFLLWVGLYVTWGILRLLMLAS